MPRGKKKEQHRKITYILIEDYASAIECNDLEVVSLALLSGNPTHLVQFWKEIGKLDKSDKRFTNLKSKFGKFCHKRMHKKKQLPPPNNWFQNFVNENEWIFSGDDPILPPYSQLFFSPLCQTAKEWI